MMDLSVIIPACNAERYLEQCLQSVFRACEAAALSFEVIVVDDGSNDNTANVAAQFKVVLISQPKRGPAAARNAGLRQAGGAFIMFQDADDILLDNAVADLYAPLAQDNDLAASFALAIDFISPELSFERQKRFMPRNAPYGGCLPGCAIVRHNVFDKTGFFDETLQAGETVAWLLAFKDLALPAAFSRATTLHRRLHPASTGVAHIEREKKAYLTVLRQRVRGRL